MPSVTLAEAQARLPELIENLIPGEELVITKDDRPVAKLVRAARAPWPSQHAGPRVGRRPEQSAIPQPGRPPGDRRQNQHGQIRPARPV
jgi:antitoxin (DNA-binding transcriptional repressor) of toxin-antitoxin stability system